MGYLSAPIECRETGLRSYLRRRSKYLELLTINVFRKNYIYRMDCTFTVRDSDLLHEKFTRKG